MVYMVDFMSKGSPSLMTLYRIYLTTIAEHVYMPPVYHSSYAPRGRTVVLWERSIEQFVVG